MTKPRPKFSLCISTHGRGAQEILKTYAAGEIAPELALVVSTTSDSNAMRMASEQGIPCVVVERKSYPSKVKFEEAMLAAHLEHEIEYVFLSGYTYKVDATMLYAYRGKMINVHPSLLPSFKGLNAMQQALEYGVKIAGISVHYVEEEIDEGKLILQGAVDVAPEETVQTLDAKIFPLGVRLMVEAINTVFI